MIVKNDLYEILSFKNARCTKSGLLLSKIYQDWLVFTSVIKSQNNIFARPKVFLLHWNKTLI